MCQETNENLTLWEKAGLIGPGCRENEQPRGQSQNQYSQEDAALSPERSCSLEKMAAVGGLVSKCIWGIVKNWGHLYLAGEKNKTQKSRTIKTVSD